MWARLGSRPDDWAAAALTALADGGLAAVRVEALAPGLGASKGSFYWHFADRAALVDAALALWEERDTDTFVDALDADRRPATSGCASCSHSSSTTRTPARSTRRSPPTRPTRRSPPRSSGSRSGACGVLEQTFADLGFSRGRRAPPRARGVQRATSGSSRCAGTSRASCPAGRRARHAYVDAQVELLTDDG